MSTPGPGRTARRSALVLFDQGLSSASNFLLVVLVARTVDPADFGTFAIAFSCLTLGLGLSRANLGVPLSVDLPPLRASAALDGRPGSSVDVVVARTVAVGATTGAALGLVIAILAVTVAGDAGLRSALLVLALASPLVVCQDVGRYVAVALGVPRRAVVSDLAWVVVALGVLVLGGVSGHESPVLAAGGWVVGGAIGLVTIRSCVRAPIWAGSWAWFARDRRRWHLSVDAATSAITPLLVVSMLATIVSPAAVGALRGASTLMSPVNVAIAAVSMGAVAEITRRDWPAARRWVLLVCAGLTAAALVWGILALALPDRLGREVLGDTWPTAHHVLPISTAEYAALALWNGAVALLRSSGRTRASASLRVVYLALALATTTAAAATFGTARGVQAALAATAVVLAVVTWVRAWPDPSPRSPSSSAPQPG